MQPTLPDEHHRRAPWQAPAERRGVRTFVGGAALGGLLGVAALQLSNVLREPDAASLAEATPPAHLAIAWLAEKPAHRATDAAPSSSSARKAARAAAAPSAEPAGDATPPEPAAERAATKPDASADKPDNVP